MAFEKIGPLNLTTCRSTGSQLEGKNILHDKNIRVRRGSDCTLAEVGAQRSNNALIMAHHLLSHLGNIGSK